MTTNFCFFLRSAKGDLRRGFNIFVNTFTIQSNFWKVALIVGWITLPFLDDSICMESFTKFNFKEEVKLSELQEEFFQETIMYIEFALIMDGVDYEVHQERVEFWYKNIVSELYVTPNFDRVFTANSTYIWWNYNDLKLSIEFNSP